MTHKIGWLNRPGTTGATWNPITGCTKCSEGCAHCYAERMSKRLGGRFGYPEDEPFSVTVHEDKLNEPLRWKKPRTVFVCSMGDLFHQDAPEVWIEYVWKIMHLAERHTFLVLTKRPERMLSFVSRFRNAHGDQVIVPNVWLGVTAENQARADERIPLLLQCPAAVRFVSYEPALGPLYCEDYWGEPGVGLDWIVCGGETGPGGRTMDPYWAREMRDQCYEVGVPFFFKQMSNKAPIPDDLLIREWPKEQAQ